MKDQINLPFWESLKRTYLYTFVNFDKVIKVSVLWMAVMLIADFAMGFPSQCTAGQECKGWQANLSMLLAVFSAVGISVAFTRTIVLKEYHSRPYLSFGKREAKYLAYNVLILVAIILASVLLLSGITVLLRLLGLVAADGSLTLPPLYFLYLLIPLLIAGYLSRLYLVLPATAVDNAEINFSKAFEITGGNAVKIFVGLFLASFPVIVILYMVTLLSQTMQLESWPAKLVVSVLIVFFTALNAILKASFLAHAYQYFLYFYNSQKTETPKEKSKLD